MGETRACGSAACATLVAAVRLGRTERSACIDLDGGTLQVEWPEAAAGVRMRGPVSAVFQGVVDRDLCRLHIVRNGLVMSAPDSSNAGVEVITLGCRLNALESENMLEEAVRAGVSDAVIVNSCAVTSEAVRQTRQAIRRAKRRRSGSRIFATGCAAEVDPEAFRAMPEVDGVIPNRQKSRRDSWTRFATEQARAASSPASRPRRARAYVEVQNGCDHRCTFCVIPFGRGDSRSVPIADVVQQVRARRDQRYCEVVLTGVDLTAYGLDLPEQVDLGHVVARILRDVPDLPRLRLSSIDAAEVDPTLQELLRSEPRLMPHVHLSLQAGDDLILKRMKRRHCRMDAVRFCARLRDGRDMAIGADLIAGFPTETDAMFENTLRLIDDCGLDYLHVFPFSPRPGTPAARMPQLPREIVQERAARLRQAADRRRDLRLASRVGRVERTLVETPVRGRTECYAKVRFTVPRPQRDVGNVVPVAIAGCADGWLHAD